MLVCMDIKTCQTLYAASGLITSMVIMVDDNDQMVTAKRKLATMIEPQLDVMDWKEMNELLLKQIESDRAQGVITKGVLYMIIAFGILGTVMMMMAERRKEFGVLIAIGMRKYKLIIMVWLETIFMTMLGVITGIVASIPLIFYFVKHPIPLTGQAGEMMSQMGFEPVMFFSTTPSVFYDQALIIFVISIFIGCYPMVYLYRLKMINAIRN